MQLIFLYGPVAAGKLTVARELSALTGHALFHNHLIVDAVAAVFPFGSPSFVALREQFWMETFEAAAREDRSLIFTFAPEPTVVADFPQRVRALVEGLGGAVAFIALTLDAAEQERRIGAASRFEFGKLTSLDLLRELRPGFDAAMAAMPAPLLTVDTGVLTARQAAEIISSACHPGQAQRDPGPSGGG